MELGLVFFNLVTRTGPGLTPFFSALPLGRKLGGVRSEGGGTGPPFVVTRFWLRTAGHSWSA